ncbi:hypothetical protein AAE02nite_45410 [Adhaeribacter aerolatus]|uniref:DUF4956 domain-containing protein n=1 Tax=Adhaeribacter aerolatus TaxID=670289 RepID=A0A512B525_9BACT|nr:DUF4956 domain-containing protein [Adhaeribacter aerolatus]GEO06877.1 hypothetical protein AAE02nite_45410 [Adhaeribacter aerolatus]
MFDIFPDQPSYEYPPLINIIYALVWSFLLSSVVAITHRLTFQGENYSKSFFQAMVLGGIITAMVMMAIGDSLARGLGVFGAMAIIRFRTRIDDPRNVLFLFAALSTGIAIGVYGYTTAFGGTLIFCSVAAVLHLSRFRSNSHKHLLSFTLVNTDTLPQLTEILKPYCSESSLTDISVNKKNETQFKYLIVLTEAAGKISLIQEMSKIEGVHQLRITDTEFKD